MAAVAVASVATVSQARAGVTSTFAPTRANEQSFAQIFDRTYGGNFVQNGDNYTNGSITIDRVDDSSDQVWAQNIVSAQVLGAFAKKHQAFGFFDGTSGGRFNKLFDVTGRYTNVTGSSGAISAPSGSFRLARSGVKTSDPTFTSSPADNVDHIDHMITFAVVGPAGGKPGKYVVGFEDAPRGHTDWDFNDLVVQLNVAGAGVSGGTPVGIPVPAAAWTGLTGLFGFGLLGAVRKARRHLA